MLTLKDFLARVKPALGCTDPGRSHWLWQGPAELPARRRSLP